MSTMPPSIQTGRWLIETGPFDYNRMRLTMPGQIVWLTERQGRLLAYLMQHPDRAISYDELIRRVWGFESFTKSEEQLLSVVLHSLRRIIDPQPPYRIITTVHKHLLLHSELCQ